MGFSSIKQKTLSVAISLLAGIAGSFFGSDLANRLIIGLAVAAAAYMVLLYFLRMTNVKNYKLLMASLYTDLDPHTFLKAVKKLNLTRMGPEERATTEIHIANGLLAAGRPHEALDLLDKVESRTEAGSWEVLFTLAANRSTCYLDMKQAKKAQRSMQRASDLIHQGKTAHGAARPTRAQRNQGGPQDFWLKARKTLAFQQLRLDVLRGRSIHKEPLLEDLEQGKAPLQRIRVATLLRDAYVAEGDSAGAAKMREFIVTYGGRLAVREEILSEGT